MGMTKTCHYPRDPRVPRLRARRAEGRGLRRGDGELESTPTQLADSSEVDVYTCAHEVTGASLARADRSLHVERRASEDTVPPPKGTSG